MTKPHLIFETGFFNTTTFYLKDVLTIGREFENDIWLDDPSVSGEHAKVYVNGRHAMIEDLNSRTGTFVNGERVLKAVLSHNDQSCCGSVPFRFSENNTPLIKQPPPRVEGARNPKYPLVLDDCGMFKTSSRLVEVISQIPLFRYLDEQGLLTISDKARLMIFDQNQIIVRQGDTGSSLYLDS